MHLPSASPTCCMHKKPVWVPLLLGFPGLINVHVSLCACLCVRAHVCFLQDRSDW